MTRSVEVRAIHEPDVALDGWPLSHVCVVDTFTDDVPECLKVVIHGEEHYLHRTTALALYEQLQMYFRQLSDIEKYQMVMIGSVIGPELWD